LLGKIFEEGFMAGSFLKKVVKERKLEVERAKKRVPFETLLQTMLTLPPVRNFREALFACPRLGVIAEIKRKAPGSASWKPRIQLERLVAAYERGGAFAVSAVTEPKHFGGDLSLINDIKKVSAIPVLRKDFIVDPYQIYESRAGRADAVLLIAESIPDKDLPRFVELTNSLGMTPVVEIHTAPDLKRAVRAGADIILINNRDLNTLKVNMQTVERLSKLVPRDNLVIAASGYQDPQKIMDITSERVRAVLVGRALIDHKTPEFFIRTVLEETAKL
jgi:indole-3-glycerol phosphate synthase